uniref:LFRYamide n=1 Tax=Charonia tritonis TaxID=1960912 RepID=A0A1S6JQ48_9CAEN|nr:LFRYamide precursor [Charonia tritonis]
MKTSAILCYTVVLVCVLSGPVVALYSGIDCLSDCLQYGASLFCYCSDLDLQDLSSADSVKRGGAFPFRYGKRDLGKRQIPFRYGKRSVLNVKRPKIPFRYGKRSVSNSAAAPLAYNPQRASAYNHMSSMMAEEK